MKNTKRVFLKRAVYFRSNLENAKSKIKFENEGTVIDEDLKYYTE
jgi:hypothetical protein